MLIESCCTLAIFGHVRILREVRARPLLLLLLLLLLMLLLLLLLLLLLHEFTRPHASDAAAS